MDFRIEITGTAPLIMHNSRLANPLDPIVKAMGKISAKRKKTDEDLEELARLEWHGSLYVDQDMGPFVPGQNIERCLFNAAKLTKDGQRIKRGLFIATNVNPLSFHGPREPAELWPDENYRFIAPAKVNSNVVMRCRPIFRTWRVDARGRLDPSVLDVDEVARIAETAGAMEGLGDWRPRYGRFTCTVEKAG